MSKIPRFLPTEVYPGQPGLAFSKKESDAGRIGRIQAVDVEGDRDRAIVVYGCAPNACQATMHRRTFQMSRTEKITLLTKRLIMMTLIAVLLLSIIFGVSFFLSQRVMMTWIGFLCAIIGGFVSIQQRIKNVTDEELDLLTRSWFQILLIPIFGGVFSLVLYCIFLSGIIKGDLFPTFFMPKPPDTGPDTKFMVDILTKTYPASGPDFAKFLFWSFVAGFSERFVPQIITKVTSSATDGRPPPDDGAPPPHEDPPASPPGHP